MGVIRAGMTFMPTAGTKLDTKRYEITLEYELGLIIPDLHAQHKVKTHDPFCSIVCMGERMITIQDKTGEQEVVVKHVYACYREESQLFPIVYLGSHKEI